MLSGRFCCLGFPGVIFLLSGRGRSFFFAVWAGARAPPKQQKKTRPRPNSRKKKRPAPSERVVVFAVWAGGCAILFAVWAGGVCVCFCCLGQRRDFFLLFGRVAWFFFFCLGRVACFFAVWAGGRVFVFAVWAGGALLFLLFRRGACFFLAVWAGDGSSLTYQSAWLVFKRPNNKEDHIAKKTRVPIDTPQKSFRIMTLRIRGSAGLSPLEFDCHTCSNKRINKKSNGFLVSQLTRHPKNT